MLRGVKCCLYSQTCKRQLMRDNEFNNSHCTSSEDIYNAANIFADCIRTIHRFKNRGVHDRMIVSVDGLTGFGDAIAAVFPKAEVQRCIVHQIRYTTKFVSYKDIKSFMKDLKCVYQADTEELALTALDNLEEKWGKKYPSSVASWRNNWPQLSTYFKLLYLAMMDITKKWTGRA